MGHRDANSSGVPDMEKVKDSKWIERMVDRRWLSLERIPRDRGRLAGRV